MKVMFVSLMIAGRVALAGCHGGGHANDAGDAPGSDTSSTGDAVEDCPATSLWCHAPNSACLGSPDAGGICVPCGSELEVCCPDAQGLQFSVCGALEAIEPKRRISIAPGAIGGHGIAKGLGHLCQ